jgi:hypothetical protein
MRIGDSCWRRRCRRDRRHPRDPPLPPAARPAGGVGPLPVPAAAHEQAQSAPWFHSNSSCSAAAPRRAPVRRRSPGRGGSASPPLFAAAVRVRMITPRCSTITHRRTLPCYTPWVRGCYQPFADSVATPISSPPSPVTPDRRRPNEHRSARLRLCRRRRPGCEVAIVGPLLAGEAPAGLGSYTTLFTHGLDIAVITLHGGPFDVCQGARG